MMDALKGIDDRSRKESAGLSCRDRSTRRNHQPSRTDQIARKTDGRDPRSQTRRPKSGQTLAAAQSQIAHALLIQFEFIHHKPVMMPEFHDDWGELAIVRAREKAEKT